MTKENFVYQAHTKQLLSLVINSLYSKADIFLRELISNSSDALDKMRFLQIEHPSLIGEELGIVIDFDRNEKTLTVIDNGVGMSKSELIDNLGTIASSGTKKFFDNLSENQKEVSNLIGQFGVGFYSVFMVASRVEVITRKYDAQANEAVKFTSDGVQEFTLESAHRDDSGTSVTLYLKEENLDYLNESRIKALVHQYSNHINYPIWMYSVDHVHKHHDHNIELPELQEEVSNTEELQSQEKHLPHDHEPTKELINEAKALWLQPKKEITRKDYDDFYASLSHDLNPPLAYLHSKLEGGENYSLLFFLPSGKSSPFLDLNMHKRVKLYIKRVFITDELDKILPHYLRFVSGVIDSQDLPLNVSREILQSSKSLQSIRKGAVKKILDLIEEVRKNQAEEFKIFWQSYGKILKEGIVEDSSNQERIAKVLQFQSTASKEITNLDDYITRSKPGQKSIYYLNAPHYESGLQNPLLEMFQDKGLEVLIMTDPIDEWVVTHLNNYRNYPLKAVNSVDTTELNYLQETKSVSETEKQLDEEQKAVLTSLKNLLGEEVSEVRSSSRLNKFPSCLIAQGGFSPHLVRLLKSNNQQVPEPSFILEVNLEHQLLTYFKGASAEGKKDLAFIILDQAKIAEGLELTHPGEYITRVNKFITAN